MIPCVVLVEGLFLYAFPAILFLLLTSLSWSLAAVLRCFEMREPMTVEDRLVTEQLLSALAVV